MLPCMEKGSETMRLLVVEDDHLLNNTLGVLFSVVVVRGISSGIWFFTYRFVMWPMLVIYPFLILLTVAIPALLYRKIAKVSIIERLRQN